MRRKQRKQPVAARSVLAAARDAREGWRKEPRTLVQLLAALATLPDWSLRAIERQCALPPGTLKQMRYDNARRFRPDHARSVARQFGLPYIVAANPNQPINELVDWEDRAMADPIVGATP